MASGLYPPGYQADLEHVWGLVQQLSDVLTENRATTARILANVDRIHSSAVEGGAEEPELKEGDERAQVNGAVEIARLHQKIAKLTEERDAARLDARKNWDLVENLMNSMENIAERVRPYTHNMHQNLLSWHKYYSELLQKERDENLAMRLDNDNRMASLGRLSRNFSLLRNVLTDGDLSAITEITFLKGQVRFFRRMAGFEPDPEMGTDEEE